MGNAVFHILKLLALLTILQNSIPVTQGAISLQDLFPFGVENGDSQLPPNDDDFITVTFTQAHFSFLNETYNTLFVSNNGLISFRQGVREFTPICGPFSIPMVMGFWGDIDTRRNGGFVHYRESTNKTILQKAAQEISAAFPSLQTVNVEWVFIATWEEVAFFDASNTTDCDGFSKRNTFQIVLSTDGYHSFATLNYNKITWTTGADPSSGGSECTGLGGRPAKAGFDFGDNITLYTIAESCTDAIINITETSNLNVPGKWVFRVDQGLESSGCPEQENGRRRTTDRIRISPSFVSMLGHVTLSLKGPCLDEGVKTVRCIFHDAAPFPVDAILSPHDKSTVLCLVPYLYTHGKMKVELEVQWEDEVVETYSSFIYTTPPPTDRLDFGIKTNGDIELTWDPSYFPTTDTDLELHLMEYNGRGEWDHVALLLLHLPNSGLYQAPTENVQFLQNLTSTYFVYLTPFLASTEPALSFPLPMYLQSELLFTNFKKTTSYFATLCDSWYDEDNGPPRELLPCPPLLEQAQIDERFEQDRLSTSRVDYFHPGASHSFRQRIPTPGGAGQQCVYKNGSILIGPMGGGTADLSSPNGFMGYIAHFINDVMPWFICCKYSVSMPACRKYYEKRPSNSGEGYVPPRLGNGVGDPHIVTFDQTRYTFNGVGEFWMMKAPGSEIASAFSLQVRMEQFRNLETGEIKQASVFTAFALQVRDTTTPIGVANIVQVSLTLGGVEVLLNGDEIERDATEARLLYLGCVSISVHPPSENFRVSIATNNGFTFDISSNGEGSALNIVSEADPALESSGFQGLLGAFDGHPGNDLTTPEGDIVQSSSSLEEIHTKFGVKWRTTSDTSLFSYKPGKTHASYQDESFVPDFEPDFSLLPDSVIQICKGSVECLFDFVSTGSQSFAEGTLHQVENFEKTVKVVETEVLMCPGLLNPHNGFVQVDNLLIDSVARFSCDDGYELEGTDALVCLATNNVWSGEIPTCSKVAGPDPGPDPEPEPGPGPLPGYEGGSGRRTGKDSVDLMIIIFAIWWFQ